MATESDQVKGLQRAILERASELSAEHVSQARMSRDKILDDARKKIKMMEQNELLAAKINADREYQRLVQASELSNQAELDRNRWGLVESVMHSIRRRLADLCADEKNYQRLFTSLLKQGVELIGQTVLGLSCLSALRAAFCSATFLLEATPLPSNFSPKWTETVNILACGGPSSSSSTYSGPALYCSCSNS